MNISFEMVELNATREKFFVSIWEEHQDRLRNFCLGWVSGDMDMVDDVMSLTAEKAFRYITTNTTPINNPFAWLCTMSRNICTDIYRAEVRSWDLVKEVDATPDTYFFSANKSETLEDSVEHERELSSLIDKILELPDDQQELLMLRVFHGLEYQKIAEITDMPAVNLRKRMQLLRTHLRKSTTK